MSDFVKGLIDDLPQQFKERDKIEKLYQVIGKQFQEVYEFYDQLKTKKFLNTAEGVQLDGIGQIVAMSRDDAKALYGITDDLSDEDYRRALAYKMSVNFGHATYNDIMSCIRILRGGNLGFSYREDVNTPATIILETEAEPNDENVSLMLQTTIPKAAGVGVLFRSHAKSDIDLVVGITSQIFESRTVSMIATPVTFDTLSDEDGDVLVDQDGDILISDVGGAM